MLSLCVPLSIEFVNCASLVGYVGPGAGLSMLGALAAVALVLLLALLAPFLFILRMVRGLFSRRDGSGVCLDAPNAAGHADDERQVRS